MALPVDETEGRKGLVMKAELSVAIDVGSGKHAVGIGDGRAILEEFEITHDRAGFEEFFRKVELHRLASRLPVVVAMEGTGGWARPLDGMIMERGYELLNVNNVKLARFKEIFPAPAKTDRIDVQKILELMQMRHVLATSRRVIEPVMQPDAMNDQLKKLTRRRRQLVDEKNRILNRLGADLHAVSPGMSKITVATGNLWFLRFLASRDDLRKLARLKESSLLKVRGIGKKWASVIRAWQPTASFSPEVEWVGPMIIADARRVLELIAQINTLEEHIVVVAQDSAMAQQIDSIPGFGPICSGELAGEIATINRFRSDSGLAIYIGMAPLSKDSGESKSSKPSKQVNRRAKAAMMTAVARHIEQVPQSRDYYEKKRAEGKTHNQGWSNQGWRVTPSNQGWRVTPSLFGSGVRI
ncbi:MAG TPA: IS110 family transposase [Thermoanaerobaculia bacterium]|nr:IS110 family transposase [Thermoanaerobaculia bacterium]